MHYLLVKTGIDFRLYKKNTLIRRLIKRIQVTNFTNLTNYFSYLVSKKNEIHILCREFLIGVTQFFRDKEAFDHLEATILPRIFARSEHEEIRVWCTGCSTGEEAYSLAMLFLDYREKLGVNRPIKIFASDVNAEAIRKASIGKYGPNIVADISLERLERYFIKGPNYYEVKKEPRNVIVFARHNVLKDPPFINLDLVTCRNMLIYLDNEVQKTFIEKVQYSLRPKGFLMLG
ncbi:MAG: protein-glutamate O-methyltransferase CheR, partial [Bacteroidota bacterium]